MWSDSQDFSLFHLGTSKKLQIQLFNRLKKIDSWPGLVFTGGLFSLGGNKMNVKFQSPSYCSRTLSYWFAFSIQLFLNSQCGSYWFKIVENQVLYLPLSSLTNLISPSTLDPYLKCVIWFSSRTRSLSLISSKRSFSSTVTVPIPSGLKEDMSWSDGNLICWHHQIKSLAGGNCPF